MRSGVASKVAKATLKFTESYFLPSAPQILNHVTIQIFLEH